MAPLDLPAADVGDVVQHEFRVVDRQEKRKRDGEPFVVLTLANATGHIATSPIWYDRIMQGWADGAECGAIVQATGHIARYGGDSRRQLELSAPLRVVPANSVVLDDFLPRVDVDPAQCWEWIDGVRADMRSRTLRRVLDRFFADAAFRHRFARTPGSIGRHHAKIGGLLVHTVEVARIARTAAKAARADVELVTVGALLHDVGKVEAYEISAAGFRYTACGHLLGHIVLGCLMLERALTAAGEPLCTTEQLLELQHLILAHHGRLEFGSPVEPLTLEAELVHWADEASAKANDVVEALADGDGFPAADQFPGRGHWRVDNRKLWRKTHAWE